MYVWFDLMKKRRKSFVSISFGNKYLACIPSNFVELASWKGFSRWKVPISDLSIFYEKSNVKILKWNILTILWIMSFVKAKTAYVKPARIYHWFLFCLFKMRGTESWEKDKRTNFRKRSGKLEKINCHMRHCTFVQSDYPAEHEKVDTKHRT